MSFSQFPKTRPPLPPKYAEIHAAHTPASSLSRPMERWLHHRVAADVLGDRKSRATLEIGAGTLNQLGYEPVVGPYDIVEPARELYEASPASGRVRLAFSDIAAVPDEPRYDRITSVATFEHLLDLPAVVSRAGVLLAPDGSLRVAISSEGTPLWTLSWKLTTGIGYRLKYGLDYGVLRRYEHVNSAQEIEAVLRYFFRKVERRVFGLNRPLSFCQFFEAREPDLARCPKDEARRAPIAQ